MEVMSLLLAKFDFPYGNLASVTLICVGLAALLAILAREQRPLADYGLLVPKNWLRHALLGITVGFTVYAVYSIFATVLGVYRVHTQSLTGYRVATAALAASLSIPVAAAQQAMISGYCISKLRPWIGRTGAVLGAALVFAVIGFLLRGPYHSFTAESVRFPISLFLIAAVLGFVRLACGNIVLSSGLLAGAIAVRRLTRKTRLLEYVADNEWTPWMAPSGDARQGFFFCCIMAVSVIAVCGILIRYGEAKIPRDQPLLTTSFKRVFPFSNMLALAPLDLWLARLTEARWRVGWVYLPRLVWILSISTINTFITLPERLLAPLFLRHRVPDPVFIIGVHRSGTTHLHNLLALDSQYCTPRNWHTMNPFGTLFTGWLINSIIGVFLTMRRPMDAVPISMRTPQEEEFAVAGMCHCSPYWGFTFPRNYSNHERFVFLDDYTDSELRRWKGCLLLFLRKLTFWSPKKPLLKSPYNTGRVAALHQLFPRAKFVHIYRNPLDVYRSNQHLAREGFVTFQLQDPDQNNSFETRFLDNYERLLRTFYRDAANLPDGNVTEVKFEDLEQDPINEIQRIYDDLGLELTSGYETELRRYVERIAGYRKNRLPELSVVERYQLESRLHPWITRWGYRSPVHPEVEIRRAA